MNYDLPKPPTGYKTDLALIIAPYFDLWFGSHIVKQLKPHRVRFIVDDGARVDDINRLLNACGPGDVKIALGRAVGIVHLKIYYLEFVELKGQRRRERHFLFGSANATKAAFGGTTNAELIAEVDLSAAGNQDVLRYLMTVLRAIETGSGSVTAVTTQPNHNVPKLFLPSFRVSAIGPAPGFDAWLQRGQLVAKYRDAQNFMTISVTLKKRLPQGPIMQQFSTRGLVQQGARNIVRYRYIGQPDDNEAEPDKDDSVVAKWKVKYCAWTHLGDWLSEECYDSKRDSLITQSKPKREANINDLRHNGQGSIWRSKRKKLFLDTIASVWDGLRSIGVVPSDFLEGTPKEINQSHYAQRFDTKISSDFVQAQDKNFRDRYVNGYEFLDVPKFRQDAVAWREFVRSWCEWITLEAKKTRRLSLIAKACSAAIEPFNLRDMRPDEIRDTLRSLWNAGKVGDRVWGRFSDDEFYRGTISKIRTKNGGRIFYVDYDEGESTEVGSDGIWSVGDYIAGYFED